MVLVEHPEKKQKQGLSLVIKNIKHFSKMFKVCRFLFCCFLVVPAGFVFCWTFHHGALNFDPVSFVCNIFLGRSLQFILSQDFLLENKQKMVAYSIIISFSTLLVRRTFVCFLR